LLSFLLVIFTLSDDIYGQARILKMSTTTSTENSGLLNVLLPEFTKDTGIEVKVFAKGTGAAIRDGMDGNVDVIFVHCKEREEKFVKDGYGAYRLAVMHNDFVILGPKADPAKIKGISDVAVALKKIAQAGAGFISRGDDSGTHSMEQMLWKASGVMLKTESSIMVTGGKKRVITFVHPLSPDGSSRWYYSIGQGMGKTLTFAEEKQAYTLSDRGTYIRYKYGRNQGLDLEVLCESDPRLFNPYGILPVNPKMFPHVKFKWADRFAKWLVSEKAQALIANYKIKGRQVFFPDAIPR